MAEDKRDRLSGFKNAGLGFGGLGLGYGGLKLGRAATKVGQTAEEWKKSSPRNLGRSFLARAKRLFRFQARISNLIRFASGDYARKYLIGDPLLAKKGDPGYDPAVDREVKAALGHKQPTSEQKKAQIQKWLKRPVKTKHGVTWKKGPQGETIAEPGQTSKPYQRIKAGISAQQKNIIAFPEAPEAVPPELYTQHEAWRGGVLPEQKKHTPVRGSSYEGSHDPGELWDPAKAKSPGIKSTAAELRHPRRREWTPEKVRQNALGYRDPMATHEARIAAGVTESSIRTHDEKVGRYLPQGVDYHERLNAQAIRDNLAGKLKALRRDVIHPLRSTQPFEPKGGWDKFYNRSDRASRKNIEIARGSTISKPKIDPGASVPIGGVRLHPAVLHQAHQELEGHVASVTGEHKARAAAIKQEVHDIAQANLSKSSHGRNLQNSVKVAVGDIFTHTHGDLQHEVEKKRQQMHTGVGAAAVTKEKITKATIINEPYDLAGWTGKSQKWVREKHKEFLHHSYMGETQAGEDEIRKKIGPQFLKSVISNRQHVPPPQTGFPALKRLGKRIGIGAGAVGAVGTAYALYRHRQKKKDVNFSADDDKQISALRRKLAIAHRNAQTPPTHDITTGAIEGGLGVLATDPLIKRVQTGRWENPLSLGPKRLAKHVGIGAIVGGVATGAVGYGLNNLLRKKKNSQGQMQFSSKTKNVTRYGSEISKHPFKMKLRWKAGTKELINLTKSSGEKPKRKLVPLSSLVGGQEWVKEKTVEKYIKKKSKRLPAVTQYGDRYLIGDGHHRLVAEHRKGRKKAYVNVEASDQKMHSRLSPIKFTSLPNRTLVARDRYSKQIHEKDTDKANTYYVHSALAGGAIGALLRKKMPSSKAILAGAGAGIGAQALTRYATRQTKDQFGDRSYNGKRIDRAPSILGGLTVGGLLAHKIYKRFHSTSTPIQFDQRIKTDEGPWYGKHIEGWLKHPVGRVEGARKWLNRADRIKNDLRRERTATGQIVDERGRTKDPEWKKPWVKKAIGTGIAVGGLLAARHGTNKVKQSAAVAAGLMEKNVTPTPFEKFSLNLTEGNVGRAIKSKLQKKFPKISGRVSQAGGVVDELRGARDRMLGKVNKSVEGEVGEITGARLKTGKKGEFKVEVDNPAVAKENLAKIDKQKELIEKRKEHLERMRHRVIGSQATRSDLENIIQGKPTKKMSSKQKLIHFQDESGQVMVRPHTRKPRRDKYPYEKKSNREGFLVGAGLGLGTVGTGYGVKYGFDWNARRVAASQKFRQEVEEEIAKRTAKVASRFRSLSSKLDQLVNFDSITYHETEADIRKRRAGIHKEKAHELLKLGGVAAAGAAVVTTNPFVRQKAEGYISKGASALHDALGGYHPILSDIQHRPGSFLKPVAWAPAIGLGIGYGAHKIGQWRQLNKANSELKKAQQSRKIRNSKAQQLSARLSTLIQFKADETMSVKDRKEQRRLRGEKGIDRSRTADTISGAVTGGLLGGATGIASSRIPKLSSIKKIDPFGRFRPGSHNDDPITDYGSTLSRPHSLDHDIGGEDWKREPVQDGMNRRDAFQRGKLTSKELLARKTLQSDYRATRSIFRRGAVGAGIGAAALALPLALKRPYPKGQGRETEGKKTGAKFGAQAGLLGGTTAGFAYGFRTGNPFSIIAGPITGAAIGAAMGTRLGGAIGSRRKRREPKPTPGMKPN